MSNDANKLTQRRKIYHLSFDIRAKGERYKIIHTKLFSNMKSSYGFRDYQSKEREKFDVKKVKCVYVNDSSYLFLTTENSIQIVNNILKDFTKEEKRRIIYTVSRLLTSSACQYGGDEEDEAVYAYWENIVFKKSRQR